MIRKVGRFINVILLYIGAAFFLIMGVGVFANLFTGETFSAGLNNFLFCLFFLFSGLIILLVVQPRAVVIDAKSGPIKRILFGKLITIIMGVLIMILAVFLSMILYTNGSWKLAFYPLIILWGGFVVLYKVTKGE